MSERSIVSGDMVGETKDGWCCNVLKLLKTSSKGYLFA